MSIISNKIPSYIPNTVKRANAGTPFHTFDWYYSVNGINSLGNGIYNQVNNPSPVPSTNQGYWYPEVNRFGYDTGLITLIPDPFINTVSVSKDMYAVPSFDLTWNWLNNNGSGSGSGYVVIYVELNGSVLLNTGALTGTYVLSLNNVLIQSLKYRMFNGLNGLPAYMESHLTISTNQSLIVSKRS